MSKAIVVARFTYGFTIALPEDNWAEYLRKESRRLNRFGLVQLTFFDWVNERPGFSRVPMIRERRYVRV